MTHHPQGRPIGGRIRQVCTALEQCGPSTDKQIDAWMGVGLAEVRKYAKRAEAFGMVAIDHSCTPVVYSVCEGWRVRADLPRKEQAPKALPLQTSHVRPVNSVFEMGARAAENHDAWLRAAL
jgi:hypothetical protein